MIVFGLIESNSKKFFKIISNAEEVYVLVITIAKGTGRFELVLVKKKPNAYFL